MPSLVMTSRLFCIVSLIVSILLFSLQVNAAVIPSDLQVTNAANEPLLHLAENPKLALFPMIRNGGSRKYLQSGIFKPSMLIFQLLRRLVTAILPQKIFQGEEGDQWLGESHQHV
ncbi:hypothetical protein WG66_000711 [Moniliophthora roreri]|nr:hypothetical protein WG66_000711 [Moniliophthora roreri]